MELKKSPSTHLDVLQQQQQVEQIPNRSTSIVRSKSSQLIPPVHTNRKQPMDEDELNKNISSEYQDIQIRTLTKWINVQLIKVNEHITHIDKDLRDGRKLLKLLSVVANNPNLKPEKGHMRIHELSNVAQALRFLQEQWGADSLPAVASESIVNGDVKSTLAITFFIMIKYQIQPILSHSSSNLKVPPSSPLPNSRSKPLQESKLALLHWVRSQLEDYIAHRIIPNIHDFSRSWRSGLAFCLLLHRHDPDLLPALVDLIEQSSHKEAWFTLLTIAFDAAEEKLFIPKYLDPADLLVEFPHEPSVMMYVTEMYKVMKDNDGKREKRLKDIAVAVPSSQLTPSPSYSHNDTDKNSLHSETSINHQQDTVSTEIIETRHQSDVVPIKLDDHQQVDTLSPEMNDIQQQLDTLSSMLNAEKPQAQSAYTLLDSADKMISSLDVSPEKKEVIMSRYNRLRAEWEIITKRVEAPEHVSNYVRSSPQLHKLTPRNERQEPVHPLDGTFAMVEEFERSLSGTTGDEHNDLQLACELFRRGVMFAQITHAINEELDVIQQIMADRGTSSVTDELIQGLENRIHIVNASIQGVRDEYSGDILCDSDDPYYLRFHECIDGLEDRYEMVRDWVDQVRVWFKEAERIRSWIDNHIKVIEERNKNDNFDPVSREMSIDDASAMELSHEHERLKHEIERFDSDDMDRLRAHVKMLTHSNDAEKELTPADTSTIEITLTTLNMLNQLTHLLNKRSHLIQLLLQRVQWEDLFGSAVQWIANTDRQLDTFLQTKARWSEKDEVKYANSSSEDDSEHISEGGIEDIIKNLVSLERKISDFDRTSYSDVLDAYQEMEALYSAALPNYLEARQLGFEKAFEDLMKRSGYSRKVVEQLLSMISTVEKFKELRDIGEKLRQQLLKESSVNEQEDDNVYAEKVQAFKEESAHLITNASTCIPYPTVPEMSTAIGANDAHDTEITNETIKSTISTYSMSLALIADALDQLLTSRYQVISLQTRVDEAFEAMTRTKNWMDERIKLLKKSRFDLMLYEKSDSSIEMTRRDSVNSLTNGESTVSNQQSEDLRRLEKERDSIALRLDQMENDELEKLFDSVRALEYDVDASNTVSIDRDALINCVESLEQTHQELKETLELRGIQLDALKKRIEWENQWSKTNSHLQIIARKMCDFNIKKARYDPAKENPDKPSYQGDHEITQSLQFLQDRVTELDERYLTPLAEVFADLNASYSELQSRGDTSAPYSIVPDFILNKQSELQLKYDDLKHLTTYTSDLVTQRGTITEFLMRAKDSYQEGEKIKDVVSKKTRRIMVKEEEDGPALDARVADFKRENKSIWEDCGKNMSYPIYNGAWLKSAIQQQHGYYANSVDANVTNSAYRSQVRAMIKALLEKKIDELLALEKTIDQCIESYRDADRMKALVQQYDQEASELGRWVNEQLEKLNSQYIDVSTEVFLPRGTNIEDLKKEQLGMVMQAESFGNDEVASLHSKIAQLVENSLEKKQNQSVNVSSAAHQLGEVMEQLSHLKKGLTDQAITLEAASKRLEWEKSLKMGIDRLEEMNEQVRQFTTKKNQLIAQDELVLEQLEALQEDLTRLAYQKNKFLKSVLPGIQLAYDAFVEYFPKLSRPMATPDHLEARMESLNRSAVRLQENVEARSKELELIKQRMGWEDMVRKALSYLSRQETIIENFVEEKARWHSDNLSHHADEDEETMLRTEWSNMFSSFKNYEEEVIQPLQKRFKSLVDDDTEYFNNSNIKILPNSFMKKMQDVQQAQSRASYYFDFSNEVVTQRCLVSAFILRTAQLEQSAELIREEFIASKLGGGNSQIVDLLTNHSERLEKFKTGIDDVRNNLAASIPFPVRLLEDVSTQAKIRDEATNSVIKETIQMRNTRLDELWSNLQQLLDSKERVSRRRLSLHSYRQQVKTVETWIESRYEILSQTNSYNLPNKEIDIEKLKDAVSQVDSVEQAMKANDNLLTLLNAFYDKCISAFDDRSLDNEHIDDDNQEPFNQELRDTVEATQQRLGQSWGALFDEVVQTNKRRTSLLIENKIRIWSRAVQDLFAGITGMDDTAISEDQLFVFTEILDQLRNKEYANLKFDFDSRCSMIDKTQALELQQLLNSTLDITQHIQDKINSVHNKIQLSKWLKKYLQDLKDLQAAVESQINTLTDLYEGYKTVSTSTDRHHVHQTLVAKYKLATDDIADLKDSINNVTSQFDSIMKEDDKFSTNQKDQMLIVWNKLMEKESAVSLLVTRYSKWMKLHDVLAEVKSSVQSLKAKIGDFNYENSASSLEEIAKAKLLIDNDLTNVGKDIVGDNINYPAFEADRVLLSKTLDELASKLHEQVTQHEKQLLIDLVIRNVRQLQTSVDNQLSASSDQCKRFNFNDQLVSSNELLEANKNIVMSCRNELDALRVNQCSKLVQEYNCTDDDVNKLLDPVVQSLQKLDHIVIVEQLHIDLESKVQQYLNYQSSAMTSMSKCEEKLLSVSEQNIIELEHQLESVEDIIKELDSLREAIVGQKSKEMKCCFEIAKKTVDGKHAIVSNKYSNLKAMINQARYKIDLFKRQKKIVDKLNDLLSFTEDMIDRLNSFQITGKGIISEERELNDMCNDFHQLFTIKQDSIDSLINIDISLKDDKDVQEFEEKIRISKEQLDVLIESKRAEASREGDLTVFLSTMEEIEKQVAMLTSAINNASPHYSALVNNKFVKSDLQSLLKNLVTAFKQHKKTIDGLFDQARTESRTQLLEENVRVSEMLQRSNKRWTQTQAAAASRERELQACINQLDHEFFTKLAMAKTTPHITHRVLQSSSQGIYPKNGKYFNATSPISSAARSSNGTKRSSKTPVSSKRRLYVPDPGNELDIRLGQIVNSSPYKITVKIVPDQVGKYWFGDVNPRLVYCRILPSQLVMVRVGGGWVELSQFLREHGLVEGNYSRPESVNENQNQQAFVPFHEAYLHTARSSSPSGRVTIRGGGGMERNSSSLASTRSSSKSSGTKSPTPGYIDGENFVSIDEAGNQIIVKMKKADDNAKTPVNNKKKS